MAERKGGIIFNSRALLIHMPGTITGPYRLQNTINDIIATLNNEIEKQFNFIDNNAKPHCTRDLENITRLEWSAMSPDMSPIEYVWDYISTAKPVYIPSK